jgi:hypothetical protein
MGTVRPLASSRLGLAPFDATALTDVHGERAGLVTTSSSTCFSMPRRIALAKARS